MKAKNSLMGILCLINKLLKIKHILALVLVFICIGVLSTTVIAQTPILTKLNIPEGGLKIGDMVPEELWNLPLQVINHPEGKDTITLNDYKGKLIILDFWATWCSPCISSIIKLDSIQQQLADELMVIPASYEPKSQVNSFFGKIKLLLPSMFEDTILKQYFPHRSVPHQVWIKEGNVFAITQPYYATFENIKNVLNGSIESLKQKKDVLDFDRLKPDLERDYGQMQKMKAVITGYIPGVGGVKGFSRKDDTTRINLTNLSVVQIYEALLPYRLIEFKLDDSLVNKIYIHTDEIRQSNDMQRTEWMERNCYTFNVVLPGIIDQGRLSRIGAQLLNGYFGMSHGIMGELVEELRDCYVLTRIAGRSIPITASVPATYQGEKEYTVVGKGLRLRNQRLSSLLSHIKDDLYIVDESGVSERLDLYFKEDIRDLDSLTKMLKEYGFDLRPAKRPTQVLIFEYI